MTDMKNLMRVLPVVHLLLTGVSCKSVFVYSRIGGDALLPCSNLVSSDCPSVSWTLYKGGHVQYTTEVSMGQVSRDSDRSSRMSVTSNCSLSLRDLKVEDAGSYLCQLHEKSISNVYLSILTITSLTTITDLLPGGNLILSCILFTFYDAGSCKSYSSNVFNISWAAENGSQLTEDSRFELIDTRCNVTLVTKLQRKDNNRKWRCQLDTTESSRTTFLDFTSAFLLQIPHSVQTPTTASVCSPQLPISRIMLCVALPVMVITVGVFTQRADRKRAKTSATGIQLQELS
ncbi:hypothetical protein PAMP_018120 [Pampus punctatissimus]